MPALHLYDNIICNAFPLTVQNVSE